MGSTEDDERRAVQSPLLRGGDFQPMSAAVQVEIAAASLRGRTRGVNEDHYLVMKFGRSQETIATSLALSDIPGRFDEYGYAMLVADGLGGTGRGAVASRVALSTLAHLVQEVGRWNVRVDMEVARQILERAEFYYWQAAEAVQARSRTDPRLTGMATTLTAAYSAGDDLFVANVGHSRAYLFRNGTLKQLTRDHTLEQHFLDRARPAPVERGLHDLKHILTDTLGGAPEGPLVEVEHFRLVDGDCLLLCTNGLTDAVDHDAIADVLALRRSPDEQCRALLDCAAQHGVEDNATAVIAEYRVPAGDMERVLAQR